MLHRETTLLFNSYKLFSFAKPNKITEKEITNEQLESTTPISRTDQVLYAKVDTADVLIRALRGPE